MQTNMRKVSIIGAGNVGATCAFALMTGDMVSDMVLMDMNMERARGEVMDLSHGLAFVSPMEITAGDMEATCDSDIVIVTAGANQKPGETRLDLLRKNAGIVRSIAKDIARLSPKAVIIIVTNPVDVLTNVALSASGFPPERVIGSGTVLDTSRLRYMLSMRTHVDTRNIHTHVIGEHGDSEVALFSQTNIAGIGLEEFCAMSERCDSRLDEEMRAALARDVRDAGYHVIDRKGSTYYAVALAVKRIVEAILRDEHSILTVSTRLEGEYGLSGVCLSLPSVVGAAGVERRLTPALSPDELRALEESARVIVAAQDSVS